MKSKEFVKDLNIGDRVNITNEGCLTIKLIEFDDTNDKNLDNLNNKSNITFEEGQVKQYKWNEYLTICGS